MKNLDYVLTGIVIAILIVIGIYVATGFIVFEKINEISKQKSIEIEEIKAKVIELEENIETIQFKLLEQTENVTSTDSII
jgi:ABC-type multidrug transport system fused ATPase/permease subunit